MSTPLESFELNLQKAVDVEDCNAALARYLLDQCMTTYSFTYYTYHPRSINQLQYDTCSANFKRWHDHYLEEQYQGIDSTLSEVYRQQLPLYWNLETQLQQARTDAERTMREDSLTYGAREGLSIPLHGAEYQFAILLVVKMKDDSFCLQTKATQQTLFIAAHLYFHYLQLHLLSHSSTPKTGELTPRELQCLRLLAKQCTLPQMAAKLQITERTVNFHIQKINKKLGQKNKYQSVMKALEQGLLTL